MNPLYLIDLYKSDHRRQYPAGTQYVYSNFTPRGSRIPGVDAVVFFGLQYFLQRYLMDEMANVFCCDTTKMIEQYDARLKQALGPNNIGTKHIEALCELGYVPLRFSALPEGTRVPLRVPMFTVENTHPDFAWLVNYFETIISNVLWKPCTSATTALRYRRLLDDWAMQTGGDSSFVSWQGHDFSFRGMSGVEDACLSAMGHLLSFTGSDTLPALDFIDYYYGGNPADEPILGSVAATEHSVMCAGGEDDELGTINRLLDLYPTGILSVVSDTWNLWDVLAKGERSHHGERRPLYLPPRQRKPSKNHLRRSGRDRSSTQGRRGITLGHIRWHDY
jgi:nicotinamide phosphoribosyltransferase